MKRIGWICSALFVSCGCLAQGSLVAPVLTMGITLPHVGQPASVQVLVTDPSLIAVPTGDVTIDFGDGSAPANIALSETRVEATHTYASLGRFTITASYSGDGSFAPASKSMTTVSVSSALAYKLSLFGDSLTGGMVTNWPAMLTTALGWTWKAYSCGGCKTNDEAPYVYSFTADGSSASTWMLGQNEPPTNPAQLVQFQAAALAQNAWLSIPEGSSKLRAQSASVAQTGTWAASDVYTVTGLRTTEAGASLTATLPGSAIYAGLTSLLTTDYTVDVLIDGVDQGTVSPVESYVGRYQSSEPYGLRYAVGGDPSAMHTVQIVCADPGTSGCYVDWVGSNGAAARSNLPPYVWMAATYRSLNDANSTAVIPRSNAIRTVEGQLESDGLPIRLADMEAVFSGAELPDCAGDGTHPGVCGNQIEETVWLSAMSFLATEAQRIDLGPVTSAVVGSPLTLDEAAATSGLPATYSVVSGPASISVDQLTAAQPGTIVIQADQGGNSTVLPAMAQQFSVSARAGTTTTLSSSASSVYTGASVTLSATVTATGSATPSGTVTFNDSASSLGTAVLDSAGTAQLTVTLPTGTHALTAAFPQTSTLLASTSAPVTVSVVLPPDFTLVATPDALTVKRGQSGMAAVLLSPDNGFDAIVTLGCSGLPPSTACTISGPSVASDGVWHYTVTVSAARTAAVIPGLRLQFAIAGLIGLLALRRRRTWCWLAAPAAAFLLAGLSACTAGSSVPPVTDTVTVTAAAATGQTHSATFSLTVD